MLKRLQLYILVLFCTFLTACSLLPKKESDPPKLSNSEKVSVTYTNVWERIRDGYGIEDLNDPLVDKWIDYYTSRPKLLNMMLDRSRKFLYYVTIEVQKRDMPTEIALLPFVESAYNVRARSSAKAVGLWQFIPSTGREYNLNQNWVLDKRRDPVESTNAALDYLRYLHDFQGKDWHLALASYNWGQGSVKRAVSNNQKKGKATRYVDLKMPVETRNYVPKLLAVARIVKNPEKYRVELPSIPDQPYFTQVPQTKNMDVQVAADLAEMSIEEFKELNPAFNTPVLLTTHRDTFLLPVDKVETYQSNLSVYKGSLSNWKIYTLRRNETVKALAKKHGMTVTQLKEVNGLSRRVNTVKSGRSLLVSTKGKKMGISVPDNIAEGVKVVSSGASLKVVQPAQPKAGITSNKPIQRKAPAKTVAKSTASTTKKTSPKTNTAQSSTKKANNSQLTQQKNEKTTAKTTAQKTRVQTQKTNKNVTVKTQKYVVKKGDTLFSIAKRYNTTMSNLKSLNNLRQGTIRIGQTLHVPVRTK